jgi:hypothetical protein
MRYIDADALLENLKLQYGEELGWQCTVNMSDVGMMIEDAPTADVAPRAEVEELIYRLECLLCHATGGRLSKHTYDLLTMETAVTDYLDESYCEGKEEGYKNAKAEVAREIFKDIEGTMFAFGTIPYNNAVVNLDTIAALKKKYTGESQ